MVEKFGDRYDYESKDTWNSSEKQSTNPEFVESTDKKNLSTEAIEGLTFWYPSNQPKNEKLMAQFWQDTEWNNSIDWKLMQNEQVQSLLSEILSEYNTYIWNDKQNLMLLINREKAILKESGKQLNEEQSNIIESMYQYMMDNDNQAWFENFILTNSIHSIKTYLSNHVGGNWNLVFCSKNEIKARLKIDWFLKLYEWYKTAHAENEEATNKLQQEVEGLKTGFSFVKANTDNLIHEYLSWEKWKQGKDQLAQKLYHGFSIIDQHFYWEFFNDNIVWIIRYAIKEYARLLNISDNTNQLWNTWDEVYDMQIRSYLYLYWVFAYNKNFQGAWFEWIKFDPNKWLDDWELWEILNAILITDWQKQNDWTNNKYLATEQKVRNTRIRQDITVRQEAWARIKAMETASPKIEWQPLLQERRQNLDIQNATWVEIAQDKNLWSEISGFERKVWKSVNDVFHLQKPVLMETWKSFIVENKGILSNYMEVTDLVKFFDVSENGVNFNSNNWESRISNHPEISTSEADHLRAILQWFPGKYQENLAKAMKLIDEKMDSTHDVIKNYAIGAIIDNIKDMFQYIVDTNTTWSFMTGFEFDENNSAKIENNCLLLSGKFNWESMNIKYDLSTWKLYMNSFIDVTSGNITLTWNSNPTSEIWILQPFDSILYEFYKAPTESMNNNIFSNIGNSPISWRRGTSPTPETAENASWWEQQETQPTPPPSMPNLSDMRDKMKREHKIMFQKMCGTKLDEIGRKIRDKIEAKSASEPVALNLLNTLWITLDPNWTKNLKWWDEPSDLYKVIQLITKEKNTENINNFSDYMKTFMNNIWLTRWENKSHQDKTWDIAKIIFDKNNHENTIKYIRDNTENFDDEYSSASGKAQFDEKSNFWILKIIEEKFTEWEYPNRKLSTDKINKFEEWLASDIRDVQYKKNVKEIEEKDVAEADDLMKWLNDLDLA